MQLYYTAAMLIRALQQPGRRPGRHSGRPAAAAPAGPSYVLLQRAWRGAGPVAGCLLAGCLLAVMASLAPVHAVAKDTAPAARPGPDATASAPAVSNAVELSGDSRSATLSFVVSKPVQGRAFVMERPDRIVIELPEVNFQLPAGAGRKGKGLVASFRYGVFAPGRSRVVIDLAAPALVASAAMVERKGALPRFDIRLAKVERSRFHKEAKLAASRGAGDAPPPPAPVAGSGDPRPVVVIDPGHGGVDNGAGSSAGLVEKEIVLAFSRRLREHLEATGRYRVVLTREDDRFVPLADRVRIAQQNRAALFLSIHADILRESPHVRGATVYTGSKFATDLESAQLADKENNADSAAGLASEPAGDEVANILLDLTIRETRAFSRELASRLVKALGRVIRMNKNPHRSARFIVLTAPDTPSALLEIGYLSSTRDADLMNSAEWRDRTTAALTEAINHYFDSRRSMIGPAGASHARGR